MKWERLKRGSATAEALACLIIVFFFLILILQVYYQVHGSMIVEQTLVEVSQMTVYCKSLDEAASVTAEEAEERLGHYMDIDPASIRTVVDYTLGSEQEWKKGNFLTITIRADLISPFTSRHISCQKDRKMMIERNES